MRKAIIQAFVFTDAALTVALISICYPHRENLLILWKDGIRWLAMVTQ